MNLKKRWNAFESRCFKAGDRVREKYPRAVRCLVAFEEWWDKNGGRVFWLMMAGVAVWAWFEGRAIHG